MNKKQAKQQAATELGVSPSTLKRWTKDFSPFLSPSSTVTGDGTGRRFTPEDVELLARIKEQLAGGLSTDEVVEQMNAEGRSETATMAMTTQEGGMSQSAGFLVLTDTLANKVYGLDAGGVSKPAEEARATHPRLARGVEP